MGNNVVLFGPTYTPVTPSDPDSGAIATFLILSHLPMLIAVAVAYIARHVRLGTAGLVSLVISALGYHACRAGFYCLGVPVNVWRVLDHTAVQWVLGELILHLMCTIWAPPRGQMVFAIAGWLVPAVAMVSVWTMPYTFMSSLVMGIFLLIVLIIRLSLLSCEGDLCGLDDEDNDVQVTGRKGNRNAWTISWFVFGSLCVIAGLVLYFGIGSGSDDASVANAVEHGLWHILSGLALLAFTVGASERMEETIRLQWRKTMMRLRYKSALLAAAAAVTV